MRKWEPKHNERYWYLDGEINWEQNLSVCSSNWNEEVNEENSKYNCFKTKKEAKEALIKVIKFLSV